MNHKEIIKRQNITYSYLNEKKLKNALDQINSVVKETRNGDLIDAHYNIETTYKSLLRYTVEGFSDPERQKIYNRLVLDIFILVDNVFGELLNRFGEGFLYETNRSIVFHGVSFEKISDEFIENAKKINLLIESGVDDSEIYPKIVESSKKLFLVLITQHSIWKTGYDTVCQFFDMQEVPWYYRSLLTTAITLRLLQQFDIKGIELLFNLVENQEDVQIKQRALTGLLLVLYNYDSRLALYPEIEKRLELMRENTELLNIIKSIIVQLIRTGETENLVKRMTDEILPEMTKIHPNLRNRLDLDNILGESVTEGKNPDWEDIFSDSPELLSKLEEFSKLQMEGSDLFMSTFRMLKHFPFFDDVANWFLPFYFPNPVIDDVLTEEKGVFCNDKTLKGLADSGVMCNSDKYSFVLSVPQMPADQKNVMGQLFLSEMDLIREVEESDKLIEVNKQALIISNQYIQDLYRFYKVNYRANSFVNPFSWSFDYYNKRFINKLFPEDDLLNQLGEYLFEKDRYKEAYEVFEILEKRADNNISMQLLQKQGYCLQQMQKYEEALALYLKADLFKHGQVWNMKKIALCYRYLKNPEKATEYYKEAENLQPDNLHTQVSIGHCLLEMKDYAEALKYYFKVEYLDPKNKKVWRPIAWCSLALGKFEQAEKYALKSINDTPGQSDFLNMGHIKWCTGNRMEALEWYRKCVKFEGNTIDIFLDSFENDKQILQTHNVDVSDIPIMLDQLKYFLEE